MDGEREPLLAGSSLLPADSVTSNRSHTEVSNSRPSGASERAKWKTQSAFIQVLITETLERTAFYGLICNMFLFLNSNPLGWMSYNASVVILMLNGVSYITAIVGGWLADSCLGKFRTIVTFFIIYIAGFVIWPLLYPYPDPHMKQEFNLTAPSWCRALNQSNTDSKRQTSEENCWWPVYLSLIVIAIGYGTVRVNLIPFGAAQVEHEGQQAMRTYFNWFYWCINIGSLLAYGILGYVQQEISYFWGYLVPNITLVCALIVFLCGSCFYIRKPATGSPISTVFKVCFEACRVWRYKRRRRDVETYSSDLDSRTSSCLDYAKLQNGGSFHASTVDEMKMLGKVVIVFISLVPYWVVYYQMQTTFIWQALHMQLDFDDHDSKEAAKNRKFNIPPAWLSLFNVLFILVLLPLLDRVIYPWLDRTGRSPSLRTRILIGMMFSIMSMVAAGIVENRRLGVYWRNGTYPDIHYQLIGKITYYEAAHMSVLYQLPQYALIGIGELFTSIAGLELAYIYAPKSMQSIIMSLFWFSQGLGALLGLTTIYLFVGVWFTSYDHGNINCDMQNKDQCHLDYYFFFLAGFQFAGIAAFVLASLGLNIGQTIPVRIQRKGCTLVRARPNDRMSDDVIRRRHTLEDSVNERFSSSD